uniref:Cathepsin L n=1 Tax=Aceria tosichella TaxID=561515 RepID=A0A6G1S606_9ACAR
MKAIIPLLLALVCLVDTLGQLVLARHESSLREWAQYKRQYGKVYGTPEEDARRFSLFMASREEIKQHNANEQSSYKLGLNHMADWTREERYTLGGVIYDPIEHEKGLEASKDHSFLQAILDGPAPLPAELDWRLVPDRVSAVRDQGKCSAGWAIAVTGVLEGQEVVRNFTEQLVTLSPQYLIDCSFENFHGCTSGWVSPALKEVANLGVKSEADFPWTGVYSNVCDFTHGDMVINDSGSIYLPKNNEKVLRTTVAKFGPVPVGIYASPKLHQYKSGIFNEPDCNGQLDHFVLIVGYGNDPKEGDYWIVKNSWSDDWGEKGYMRIKFGVCGLGQVANIPTFDRH